MFAQMFDGSKRHIMVDLETMGLGNEAAIIAIGAAEFDLTGVRRNFYKVVDLKSSVDEGMEMDVETILWWLQQSEEARMVFSDEAKISLYDALSEFAQWLLGGEDPTKLIHIWGNGAKFDNVILSSAYKLIDMHQPWSYKGDMCYRTVKNMFPHIKAGDPGDLIKHHALDDANYQVDHLIKIVKSTMVADDEEHF